MNERIEIINTLLTAQEERMAQGYITGSISVVDARYLLDHIAALEARPTKYGDEDVQQALDFLRAERQHEDQALFVSIHTGAGLEHVWTLLDYVAALENVVAVAKLADEANQGLSMSDELWYQLDRLHDNLAALDALGENKKSPDQS